MPLTTTEALSSFHARFAGASDRVFGRGTVPDGRSSYQWLADQVPPEAARVLDLACGDGALLARLARPGREIMGLDRSEHELAAARARLGPEVALHHGVAQALPFPDGSFDAVTCHMAFMLMAQAEAVVAEIRRVLAPGGVFAGVIGVGGPKSPLQTGFFKALHDAQVADGLDIAWEGEAHGAEDLARLLDGWALQTTPLPLTVAVPRAELGPFVQRSYYSAGLLSPPAFADLLARTEALAAEHAPDGPISWTFQTLGFSARTPLG